MSSVSRILSFSAAALAFALAAGAQSEPAPPTTEPLPPPAPGREVVVDSSTMLAADKKEISLSDLDPETAEIVHEVNSKPGTWQLYLLYTAEDLPEIMFHPGFAIRLPSKPKPLPPAKEAEQPPAPARASAPAPAAPAPPRH